MKIGFIGVGAISEHVITGLMQHGGLEEELVLSERSRQRSQRLSQRFDHVRVEPDNQKLVDQVDIVFVATLPQQTLKLLDTLIFRQDQTIASLAAAVSVEQIASRVKPASRIHRAIPMPPNEIGVGPIPVYPPSPVLESLLSRIGTVIPVENQQEFSVFSAGSAVMATFFELVAANARWLQNKGIAPDIASRYSTTLFHALVSQLQGLDTEKLQSLSAECLTQGGLNEQVLNASKTKNWFDAIEIELDRVLQRISD